MRDLRRYQSDYEALPFESVQARYRRKKVLEVLARLAPRRVLEVGCGLEPLFMDYRGYSVMHVVEPTPDFYEHASEQARGVDSIHVHHGTLEQTALRLTDQCFDCIVIGSLLHELSDPENLLSIAHGLCGTDTVLHVNVSNAFSLHRRLAVAMGLISDVHQISETQVRMQQARTYDAGQLRALLERSGFDVFESGDYFVKPFTHAQMAALMEQGVLTESVLDGLYALSDQLPNLGSEIYANARRKA